MTSYHRVQLVSLVHPAPPDSLVTKERKVMKELRENLDHQESM